MVSQHSTRHNGPRRHAPVRQLQRRNTSAPAKSSLLGGGVFADFFGSFQGLSAGARAGIGIGVAALVVIWAMGLMRMARRCGRGRKSPFFWVTLVMGFIPGLNVAASGMAVAGLARPLLGCR